MSIKINYKIPSTMTESGLTFLGEMAKSVPQNGTIVEIGPLFGSSSWVLAKNAHPSVQVISIDTWEPAPWIKKVEAKFKNCKPFSKDAFLYYTRDCPNIKAIQGWSPEVVANWDLPIDLFFDDATHGDPGFSENINFFVPFIKENGILCGDDYTGSWPDIVRVVDELGNRWERNPEVIGRVWAMTKPIKKEAKKSQFVHDKLEKNSTHPSVKIITKTLSGKKYELPNGTWSGATHKGDRIMQISLTLENSNSSLDLEWRIQKPDGSISQTLSSGQSFTLDKHSWIAGISIKLIGKNSNQYFVEYKGCFRWHAGDGKRYPTSKVVRNGELLTTDNKKIALTSLQITVSKKTTWLYQKLIKKTNMLIYQNRV